MLTACVRVVLAERYFSPVVQQAGGGEAIDASEHQAPAVGSPPAHEATAVTAAAAGVAAITVVQAEGKPPSAPQQSSPA